MAKDVETVVYVGDGWCFCGHLKESCNDCCIDHRGSNNWGQMKPLLEESGWPKAEIVRILDDELEIMRRPAFQVSHMASKPGYDSEAGVMRYKCNAHGNKDCPTCFDFGAFLLQDVELWDQHLMYPRLRGFPAIAATSLPSPHTLTFQYPNFRLLNQLPAFDGHTPLGWVLFAIVVARRGPGMLYTIKDASGASIQLQFVQSWALEGGGGDPKGKDAEQYKNLVPGTLLSLKCVTMSMTARNKAQVAVEQINLCGVNDFEGFDGGPARHQQQPAQSWTGTLLPLRKSGRALIVPSLQVSVLRQDWKEGGHKKACATIAHL
ncbi:hypothetical protein C8R43DRAFT_955407 [Mycena crocata]|nr:hypothetical protein C8R43DRAFT_955407 [Mycena crocata]